MTITLMIPILTMTKRKSLQRIAARNPLSRKKRMMMTIPMETMETMMKMTRMAKVMMIQMTSLTTWSVQNLKITSKRRDWKLPSKSL